MNPAEDERRRDDFGDLVEDSINADQGKMIKNLEERGLMAATASVDCCYEMSDSSPSSSTITTKTGTDDKPVKTSSSATDVTESSSNPTTVTAIVVGTLVAFIIAAFLFYKGIQRSKVDNEWSPWLPDEHQISGT